MHKYDFDKIIDRQNTSSIKYDFGMARMGRTDLLPLWVADMDFRLPDEILDEIKKRVDHGIFGYSDPDREYFEILNRWTEKHYGYHVEPEYVTVTPGLVYALAQCIRAFTRESQSVLLQQPVYYPFKDMIELNGRNVVDNPLVLDPETGGYHMDLSDFERKIVEKDVKLFILCNPHNPVGRVWTEEELKKVGDICLRHGVIIVSDEIHCDFIYPGHKFTSFLKLDEESGHRYSSQLVVLHSLSKTFNLAGLQLGHCFIRDEELRRKFRFATAASGYSQANVIAMTALKAAYTKGEEWHKEVLSYIEDNTNWVRNFLREKLPKARLTEPEGTYLLWVDLSGYGFSDKELEHLIVDEAKLWLDSGAVFGPDTAQFERFNIACPRSIVEEAFARLRTAIESRVSKDRSRVAM